MECIFLNAVGTTLFVRDDMVSGHWVQQQMNLTAEFPYNSEKVIQFGQRIAFRDPATDIIEVFEICTVRNMEPGHYQQITAEHICVAELSDEHIDTTEITDKTAAQALTTALTGTLWSVGNNTASGTQSADFSRGSVWDAVNTIQNNWNVYITPRVTISSAGAITGRYLDIAPATGTWRGLRLSIRKNLIDPIVTYDDSQVYTALYGYGGNVDKPQASGDDKSEQLTFKDVVWTATSEHPAKPANQTYLEWPEKTAIYGRNGRPRYGYYQNGSIKDASILLQKTWESLQAACEPKISIAGTCVDMYRLGYKDQPVRLHDLAVVEIEETGESFYRQVICNDVDLMDAGNTRPEIGDYIANIIYINRDTDKKASGGGGGGGHGTTNAEDEEIKTFADFFKTQDQVGMVVGLRNGDNYIRAGQIVLAINESGESGSYESAAYIEADRVNISGTQTVQTIAGAMEMDSSGHLVIKEGAGLYAQHTVSGSMVTVGVYDEETLTGGICVTKINGQAGTVIKISADVIDIDGVVTALESKQITCGNLTVQGTINATSGIYSETYLYAEGNITCNGTLICDSFNVGGTTHSASWKQQTVVTSVSISNSHSFLYGNAQYEPTGRASGSVVLSTPSTATIHYLGY